MNSARELFLSPKNLEENFNNVSDELLKSTGYNISNQVNLRTTFNSMAEIVIRKTDERDHNLAKLNSILVDKCSSYFKKMIQERNRKKEEARVRLENRNIPGQNPNNIEFDQNLGFSYMKDNQDMNNKYNELIDINMG